MTPQTVLLQRDPRGVATLTLNRPERRNAFDAQMIEALSHQLEALARDPAVRVVILTGAGETFCAGADVGWMQAMAGRGPAENRADAQRLARLLHLLDTFPLPTLARIAGPAFGGGAGLVACCDIALASSRARFGFAEVQLGLVAAVIAPYVLAALGVRQARRLLLSGAPFDAEQALRLGLVHDVLPPEALDQAVAQQVEGLLRAGPQAVRETKALLGRLARVDAEVRDHTAGLIARVRASEEAREGMAAFLEKRAPRWRR